MSDYLRVCEEAARAAGAVLLDWRGRISIREKGPCDPVTEADFASQEVVRSILQKSFPDHDFLSEEEPHTRLADGRYRWILDPLDGTQNYVHGLPLYAVSLGLERNGQMIVGCIFNPELDECYTVEAGQGAFCNGRQLRTSPVSEISQALVAVSLPPRVRRDGIDLANVIEIAAESQGIRRFGSSAMNLCFVAAGSLDAFFATETLVWDIAAGILLVEEAGGSITNFKGGPVNLQKPQLLAAASEPLSKQLQALLRA